MTLYEDMIVNLVERDPRVMIMTAENRAPMRTIIDRLGTRFVDVGIAEQTLIGMAVGLALRGRRPLVHALATFLTMRAFEFVRTDIGIGRQPVILIGFVPGFQSDGNGPTHQAIEDIALMRGIPGMNVFCPSDEEELATSMPDLVTSGKSWYVRFAGNKRELEAAVKPPPVGQAGVIRDGKDITIISYGPLLYNVLKAARILEAEGLTIRVVHMPTLKPCDSEAVASAFRTTSLVVTVEDHFRHGGLGSIVTEIAADLAEDLREGKPVARLLTISLEDHWFKPGLLAEVLAHEGFQPQQIADRIRTTFRRYYAK